MHYSQNDEQEIVARWFAENPPKYGNRLVDIGAWTGVELSNSRALIEAGWRGLLVEAAAGPFVRLIENCRSVRDRVALLQAFVTGGTEYKLQNFQHTQDAVSTSDKAIHQAWSQAISDYFEIVVPVVPLAEILRVWPGPYDFATIDTEGETLSIFTAFLELEPTTSCIVVEHASAGVSHLQEMLAMSIAKGYEVIAVNGENLLVGRR